MRLSASESSTRKLPPTWRSFAKTVSASAEERSSMQREPRVALATRPRRCDSTKRPRMMMLTGTSHSTMGARPAWALGRRGLAAGGELLEADLGGHRPGAAVAGALRRGQGAGLGDRAE